MKLRILALAAAAIIATSAQAAPITYTGVQTFTLGSGYAFAAPETAYLSFTTDGTIGAILPGDILGYDVAIVDSSGRVDLTAANSTLSSQGSPLQATATGLLFDFGAPSGANMRPSPSGLFIDSNNSNSQFGGVADDSGRGSLNPPVLGATGLIGYDNKIEPDGLVTIATVSGAPEPSTWALMLAGVGLMGAALRRTRRSVAVAA